MTTIFTSLSSFFIDNANVSRLQGDFEKLREFSKINFVFVIQDKINSTLAIVEDCLEINNVCFEMCGALQILETYNKHKNKSKVGQVLRKYGSTKNLLKQSSSEINSFHKRLLDCDQILKEIQNNLIESEYLVCEKCQGKGTTAKTKYARERGSPPQPILETKSCTTCKGTGKIVLDSETKQQLSDFIQHAKPIHKNFEIHKNTLNNYAIEYKTPSLQGYDEIENIFPEEKTKNKKTQQPLTKYY